MNMHRVGIYVEADCPGVDERDAANRAAAALARAADGGLILLYASHNSEDLCVEARALIIREVSSLGDAARRGLIRVVPAGGPH
jgi:hypothetical protein